MTEYVGDDEVHALGFANLYQGEVYGECMCGWSTTAEPVEPLLAMVEEVWARVWAHVKDMVAQREARELAQTPPPPRRRRRVLRLGGRVKSGP